MAIVINVAAQADLGVFKNLIKALDDAKASMDGFSAAAKQAGKYTGGSGRGPKPGSPGPQPGPGQGPTPYDHFRHLDALNRASGGKFQQMRNDALKNAWNAAQQGAASGDPGAIGQLGRLAGPMAKMGQGFGQSFMKMLSSSRFGIGGGGVIPARVGQFVGMLGKAGPIGLAITAAAAALFGLAAIVKSAGEQMRAFTGNMLQANTSASTMQQLNKIGSLLGGDMAQRSRQFRETIGSNGVAMDAAMRAGISPVKDPFGRTDLGADFAKALRQVAGASSESEARRLAELYEQPDMARAYYLSDSTKNYMFNQAEKAPSKADMQAGEEFTFWLEEFKRVGMEFVRTVGTPLLSGLSKITQMFTGWAQGLKKVVDFIGSNPILRAIFYGLVGQLGGDGKSSGNKIERAMDRNTNAINANTRALGDARGIFGGGQRAQRAIPSKVKGMYMNQAAYRQALSTGLL